MTYLYKKLCVMKKLKKIHKAKSFLSINRLVLAALAGAVTGLAVTYLLETEKGRTLLGSVKDSVKNFTGNLNISKLLQRG
jgi:hypothetical protein